MSDALFQTLLRELFEGDDDRLRDVLRPLTAEQRKALFDQFDELFKALRRACRYEQEARPAKLADLYRAIREDQLNFCAIKRPRWPRRVRSTIRRRCKAACFNSALTAP